MAMAAIGISTFPPSKTLTVSNQSNDYSRRISKHFFRTSKWSSLSSSSSSSHVYGDKLSMRAGFWCRTKTAHASRMPVLVSPKAVSDSHNSLTCLDPDASRVSTLIQRVWFCMDSGFWNGSGSGPAHGLVYLDLIWVWIRDPS